MTEMESELEAAGEAFRPQLNAPTSRERSERLASLAL